MFSDLVTKRVPTHELRLKKSGGEEHYLTEGAVMFAYAMHLFRSRAARHVRIHPDGEHGKQFPLRTRIEAQGYALVTALGSTAYGGLFRHKDGREITVHPKSGLGDVVADLDAAKIVAEAKGGVLNSAHSGQLSRLRRGICEAVGLLLATANATGLEQVAVVPHVGATEQLATKMIPRTREIGITFALVSGDGSVMEIR
jgi:hypothetical protein